MSAALYCAAIKAATRASPYVELAAYMSQPTPPSAKQYEEVLTRVYREEQRRMTGPARSSPIQESRKGPRARRADFSRRVTASSA